MEHGREGRSEIKQYESTMGMMKTNSHGLRIKIHNIAKHRAPFDKAFWGGVYPGGKDPLQGDAVSGGNKPIVSVNNVERAGVLGVVVRPNLGVVTRDFLGKEAQEGARVANECSEPI